MGNPSSDFWLCGRALNVRELSYTIEKKNSTNPLITLAENFANYTDYLEKN